MHRYRLAFLGHGVVAHALQKLLDARREALAREYSIDYLITGVASRRLGWHGNPQGLDTSRLSGPSCPDMASWLAAAQADVLFETIALDPHQGQPALGYLECALNHGLHVISANKGPVVHGYRRLGRLARRQQRAYRFESAVMDGAPVFSLVRECLPLVGLHAVRGIFTSTATIVLEAIEGGMSVEAGIERAQQLGIAEADPSYDVDGWDSAVKLCALANVLLGEDLKPTDLTITGVRSVPAEAIRSARAQATPYRLVGEVTRDQAGECRGRVLMQRCDTRDPLYGASGTTLVTHFEAEMFPGGLTVVSRDPDTTTTAYGMLADFIGIVRDPSLVKPAGC